MNRFELLAKMDELHDRHCKGCTVVPIKGHGKDLTYCNKHCEIGEKLQQLGKQFETIKKERKALGERRLVLDKVRYYQLKKDGKSDVQIARDYGIKQPTLSYYKKKWKETATEKPIQADTLTERTAETKNIQNENEAKLQALVNDLSNEVNNKTETIKQLEGKVAELEHINAACDDVENETASLKDEISKLVDLRHRDSYDIENMQRNIENLDKTLQRYEKENKALRELIALWI